MIKEIIDALERFKKIYGYEYEKSNLLEPFRPIMNNLEVEPRISLYPDGAKMCFRKNKKEITIDYNFDEPFDLFVSTYQREVLYIKDATFENLEEKIKELIND